MHYMLTGLVAAAVVLCAFAQDIDMEKRGLREFYYLQQMRNNAAPEENRPLRADGSNEGDKVSIKLLTAVKSETPRLLPIAASKPLEDLDRLYDPTQFKRTNARAAATIRRLVARLVSLGIGRWGY